MKKINVFIVTAILFLVTACSNNAFNDYKKENNVLCNVVINYNSSAPRFLQPEQADVDYIYKNMTYSFTLIDENYKQICFSDLHMSEEGYFTVPISKGTYTVKLNGSYSDYDANEFHNFSNSVYVNEKLEDVVITGENDTVQFDLKSNGTLGYYFKQEISILEDKSNFKFSLEYLEGDKFTKISDSEIEKLDIQIYDDNLFIRDIAPGYYRLIITVTDLESPGDEPEVYTITENLIRIIPGLTTSNTNRPASFFVPNYEAEYNITYNYGDYEKYFDFDSCDEQGNLKYNPVSTFTVYGSKVWISVPPLKDEYKDSYFFAGWFYDKKFTYELEYDTETGGIIGNYTLKTKFTFDDIKLYSKVMPVLKVNYYFFGEDEKIPENAADGKTGLNEMTNIVYDYFSDYDHVAYIYPTKINNCSINVVTDLKTDEYITEGWYYDKECKEQPLSVYEVFEENWQGIKYEPPFHVYCIEYNKLQIPESNEINLYCKATKKGN